MQEYARNDPVRLRRPKYQPKPVLICQPGTDLT